MKTVSNLQSDAAQVQAEMVPLLLARVALPVASLAMPRQRLERGNAGWLRLTLQRLGAFGSVRTEG